ncbi:MAG: segregation/condensation protein A [Bacilli bacterium]|nr:segregation/condensation protein A [Bacilli bacterium]
MNYSIKIDAFEGPLDLLLHLIKEKNVDIYDISIEEITKSYLDYINKMEELNINVASSYLVMAAELMEIKSKSLLPKVESEEDNEEEVVSRENLINKLVEYKKYKEMTEVFKELEINRNNIYIKPPENINNYINNEIYNEEIEIDKLVEAMKNFLNRKELEKPLKTKITNKEYSVKERKNSIRNIIRNKKRVEFTELFEEYNKSYIAVTFLSVLELAKEHELKISQDKNFDNIFIEGAS